MRIKVQKYTIAFAVIAARQLYVPDIFLFSHLYTCTVRYWFSHQNLILITKACVWIIRYHLQLGNYRPCVLSEGCF